MHALAAAAHFSEESLDPHHREGQADARLSALGFDRGARHALLLFQAIAIRTHRAGVVPFAYTGNQQSTQLIAQIRRPDQLDGQDLWRRGGEDRELDTLRQLIQTTNQFLLAVRRDDDASAPHLRRGWGDAHVETETTGQRGEATGHHGSGTEPLRHLPQF